jgi:hypothetical protein
MELGDGRIGYSPKMQWQAVTTAVVTTQPVRMERLCALAPPPGQRLVT